MDEEEVRLPDSVITDRLISNYEDNIYDQNDDFLNFEMNVAIEESRIEYENQIKKEQYKKHLINLFQKLDIQINYLLLQNDNYINYFADCFNIEKNKFLNDEISEIYLFKSHYIYLKKLLEDIHTLPISKNKCSKIDKELYELLINNIKCI